MTLDMGEDRLVLESKSRGYLLDVFLPCTIYPEKVLPVFNKMTKVSLNYRLHTYVIIIWCSRYCTSRQE